MKEIHSFALARDGNRYAVADGPELFVYRGDGKPVWKQFCDGVIVGVAFGGEYLLYADADGRVVFHRAADGRTIEEIRLPGLPVCVFSSADGAFGVGTNGGPVIVAANGQHYGFPIQQLSAAAFGPDRNSLGVGTEGGSFHAIDPATGAAWGTVELGVPISGITWCAQGFWLVVGGGTLFRVDGGGTTLLGRTDVAAVLAQVTCNPDGALAASVSGTDSVAIFELHTCTHVGDVAFRREVHGVCFGPSALLGIGLDDGDASSVDLVTRQTIRTEPHVGRGRNNWNLDMNFEPGPIRGAVTFLRAGGETIAQRQYAPEEAYDSGPSNFRLLEVGCMLMLGLTLGCSGCIGMTMGMRYFGYL